MTAIFLNFRCGIAFKRICPVIVYLIYFLTIFFLDANVSSFDASNPVAIRRHNIALMQNVLKKDEYEGYDIIIISSTTQEEAKYQQQVLEKAFRGTTDRNGKAPIILSVVDLTEGGQIIGAIFTWLTAEEMFKMNCPHLVNQSSHLIDYVRTNQLKVAVYHNGGRGERFSPLTQSLGNSRGAQKLVGSVKNALGNEIELEVLLGVVLQCSSFAKTNKGTHIDTFWTSQIAFGSNPHDQIVRSNFAMDKFLVGFNKSDLIAQNIADFGTAALSQKGQMKAFYGNKRFASRKGNQYVIDQTKIESELFSKGERFAYDFGSFSCRFDMWQLLMDYWQKKNIFSTVLSSQTRSLIKREIDPCFIQPLVRFLYGLNELASRESIERELFPPTSIITQKNPETAREYIDRLLKQKAPEAHTFIWQDIENEKDQKKKSEAVEAMNEAIEFYLIYRQSPVFLDLTKVFGFIDLGDSTQWFRYRRPIDIMNEKLEMLTDIIGKKIEIQLDGSILEHELTSDLMQRCIEARLMRGIQESQMARFTVEGKPVTLSLSDVKNGIVVEGVFVKNSIIQNCNLTQGSSIMNSVLHQATGKIYADHAYIESSVSPLIHAKTSVIHEVVDQKPIFAEKEVVSDVFRVKIHPPYHGRMRAPIGYDPKGMPIFKIKGKTENGETIYDHELDSTIRTFIEKVPYDLKNVKEYSDETARTEDGRFTFEEIRSIEPFGIGDIHFRESLKKIAIEAMLK